jgi:hypothetical protein
MTGVAGLDRLNAQRDAGEISADEYRERRSALLAYAARARAGPGARGTGARAHDRSGRQAG